MIRTLTLPLIVLAALGCATAYQPLSTTGGYTEIQTEKQGWIVNFYGNGFTEQPRAQDFALLRGCELILAAGCTHYRVVEVSTAHVYGGGHTKPRSQVGVACADPKDGLDAGTQAAAIRSKYGLQN